MVCTWVWLFAVRARSFALSISKTRKFGKPVTAPVAPSVMQPMPFMQIENRSGDSGHPCLTPCVGWTLAHISPSIRMYLSSW
eukprot:1149698-Pelagomonas_calceolata.AAC.1